MISKGSYQDIDSILDITKACAQHMIENQIFQWNEHYPNRNAFEQDMEREELYVMKQEEVIGCITLSNLMDDEYTSIEWLTPNTKNLYIHRLAVHPSHQGKGMARQLMDFAEAYAKDHDYTSIRLDTFSQNKRNQKFYLARGYKQLGNIYFPKQSEYPFYCYELVL